jgi:hypothetical protein
MQRNTTDVILSCHFVLSFIREARNFNSVCCNCCYGTTGASLTARRAACAHTYVTCVCIPDTTGRGHATRTRSTCFVRELRHPNLPQQKARQRPAPRAPRANGWDPVWTAPARRGCPSRTASRRYPRSRGDSLAPSRPRQRPEPLAPAKCWDPVWAPQARRVAGTCPAHARGLRAGARSARRARRGSRVAACIAVARAPRFPAARLPARTSLSCCSAACPCSGLKSSGVGALCPDRARGRGAHRAGPWSAARAGAPAQRASVASKGRGAGAGAKGVRRL